MHKGKIFTTTSCHTLNDVRLLLEQCLAHAAVNENAQVATKVPQKKRTKPQKKEEIYDAAVSLVSQPIGSCYSIN